MQIGKILLPDAGVAGVRADQHVADRVRTVGEVRAYPSRSQPFEPDEFLTNDILEPLQQQLAQLEPADRPAFRLSRRYSEFAIVSRREQPEPLVEEVQACAGVPGYPVEAGEDFRRKAGPQRVPAVAVQMKPIAFQVVGRGRIALEDHDRNAGLLQPMRQTKPAEAAADDDDFHASNFPLKINPVRVLKES